MRPNSNVALLYVTDAVIQLKLKLHRSIMLPEISEFSYGFALTNELVGWTELSAAPIFPSLIEEGKAGGGYDVKLDWPGAPLYLQFKRSERMERCSAREYRFVRDSGGQLHVPFYRFPITMRSKSDQHELLLALDTPPNLVFYVAPRFHRITEINDAWRTSAVASRSVFISPNSIGSLNDDQHRIAFDGTATWVCSEPRSIDALTSRDLLTKIQMTLQDDQRPLRQKLPELVDSLRSAQNTARHRLLQKQREAAQQIAKDQAMPTVSEIVSVEHGARFPWTADHLTGTETPEPSPPATREAKALRPELRALREAADVAAQEFDVQLVIVQPTQE